MPKKAKRKSVRKGGGGYAATPFNAEGLSWTAHEETAYAILTLWIASNRLAFGEWFRGWARLLGVSMSDVAVQFRKEGEEAFFSLSFISNLLGGKSGVYSLRLVIRSLQALDASPFWALAELGVLTPPVNMMPPEGPYSRKVLQIVTDLQEPAACLSFANLLKKQHKVVGQRAEECVAYLVKLGGWSGKVDYAAAATFMSRLAGGKLTVTAAMVVGFGAFLHMNGDALADEFDAWRARKETVVRG